ncbi:hypothetical protein [Buttiauxella agrestis]|uniref:hypothetical protein n=1 Tax=Buttiauxella agrestis TaxID=82977 RepID=UPI001561527E|nr:hypothetical protein [Buttiauxella agrestis]BCG10893.1 hypothetical protein BADSM9389_35870 [Buttiauxella agrestis]
MPQTFDNYDKSLYLEWHRETVEDVDFEKSLIDIRHNLKANSQGHLSSLAQLLIQIKVRTEPECRLQSKGLLTGEFQLPINSFSEQSSPDNFDALFKSVDSIIEKCWRKNAKRKSEYVSSQNINNEITDLIRTSVVCPTLLHAKMFSERLQSWRDFIPEDEINEYFDKIDRIVVDEEAKPASGYFAYHALVYFIDGLIIEVQFYSLLSSAWRNMSHKLYEKTRIGSSPFMGPGSPEARLISLGHMLHLAEFELNRLTDDLKRTI